MLSPFGVAFICIIHINYGGEWGGRGPDHMAQLEKHPFGGGCVWHQTPWLPNWSIFWDGGDYVGEGRMYFSLVYVYLYHYVFQCLTVILIFALSVSACLWYICLIQFLSMCFCAVLCFACTVIFVPLLIVFILLFVEIKALHVAYV